MPAVTYNVGNDPLCWPGSVVVGDFNNDGFTDIATANIMENDVSLLLGNGDGTFQDAQSTDVDTHPRGLLAAQFTSSGNLDLAVTEHIGRGDPAHLSMLLGQGDGSFYPGHNFSTGTASDSLAAGDFNNDGNLDLVVPNSGDGTVSILLGNGDGTFQPAVNYPAGHEPVSVAVGNFFGDGNLSLAVADEVGNSVDILHGNGDGTFGPPQAYPAGSQAFSITTADFNGDGSPDLAVADRAGGVTILLNNGDGTFRSGGTLAAGFNPWSITTADFNGDNIPDLAVANNGSSNVSVFMGNGDGTFQNAVNYDTGGSGTFSIAVGDFNGDGLPDIVTANRDSGNVSVLLNQGGNAPSPGHGGHGHNPAPAPAASPGTDGITASLLLAERGGGNLLAGRDFGSSDDAARLFAFPAGAVQAATTHDNSSASGSRQEAALSHDTTENITGDQLFADSDLSGSLFLDRTLLG
jgi:hypothetical protein